MYEDLHPAVRKHVTICRCNNIKLGTIESAIENGASTIPEVAKATTATTGECGGSCTPKVLELIESLAPVATSTSSEEPDDADAWWVR